jgi:CBS domain containing-hemolysin-like protein
MDSNFVYRILLMFLIIGLNAFFAGSETALVSVRLSRLRELAEEHSAGAQAALSLLAKPERLLSVVQVGLTVCSLALGWVGEETLFGFFISFMGPILTPATSVALHGACLALAFALMTFVHVVLGEVVPKNLAMDRADRLAVLVAPILLIFYRAIGPFVWTIERTAAWVSRMAGLRRTAFANPHSIEEIKFILGTTEAAGNLSKFERVSVENMLDLRTLLVREVMVPRDALTMVPADASYDTVLQTFADSRHSRLPIYEGTRDNILGIVHAKDMLAYARTRNTAAARLRLLPPFDLRHFLREMPFVPETKPLDQHLDEMRVGHAIISFVVDEYGTIAGMISADDVLEQVFGRIRDEFDPREVKLEIAGPFDVEGTIPIRDLETGYGIELPVEPEYETLAGFLLFRLRRIPIAGDSVEYGGRRFEVTRMEANRIDEVHIESMETEAEN